MIHYKVAIKEEVERGLCPPPLGELFPHIHPSIFGDSRFAPLSTNYLCMPALDQNYMYVYYLRQYQAFVQG